MKNQFYKMKILITITIIFMLLFVTRPLSFAVLQSRPDKSALVSVNTNYFFEEIRKMESEDGTIGKASNIDFINGTYDDTSKNGLDVHMIKNTEYGATALLAVSSYGAIRKAEQSNMSTTGNATGVYEMVDKMTIETVAAYYVNPTNSANFSKLLTAAGKYKDVYESAESKPGDGTIEAKNFTTGGGYFPTSKYAIFYRGYLNYSWVRTYSQYYGGKILAYRDTNYDDNSGSYGNGAGKNTTASRAVMVVGKDL